MLEDAAFVFTTDLHGVITSCNQGGERYGFAAKDLVGKNICNFYNVGERESRDAIASVVETGQFEGQLRCRTKSGADVEVHLCLTLLRNSDAGPVSIVGLAMERAGGIAGDAETKLAGDKLSTAAARGAAGAVALARREIDGTEFLIASPIMHKFMGMVDRVAGHTETVLVTGETGTGKELVARTIHRSSYRHKQCIDRYQLRRLAGASGGKRIVRLREGSFQWRGLLEAGFVRTGRQKHDISRRNRRIAAADSGEVAAGSWMARPITVWAGIAKSRWMCGWLRPPIRIWSWR